MTHRRIIIMLMFVLFTAGAVSNTHAQVFKNMFGKKSSRKHKADKTEEEGTERKESKKERKKRKKEEKRKEKESKKKKHKNKDGSTSKKKKKIKYAASEIKDRYRVDVLMYLYLDELVQDNKTTFKDNIPDKAAPGIAFYQGLQLAADSLKRAGYRLEIYIHDITSPNESPELLTNEDKLDSADLIIGAVQSRDVPVIAAYAKKKKINFISVLSSSDGGVKDNQYFTMVQPSLKGNCDWIIADITKKFPKQKVALLYRTQMPPEDIARGYFAPDEVDGIEIIGLECNEFPTKEKLLGVFDSTRPNFVIIPIVDTGYADSLLKALSDYFPGTHFEIYGMPTWTLIGDLKDANAFRNLSVNIAHPFNFDQSQELIKKIGKDFRKQFNGRPSEFVLRGYETMSWYAGLLKKYGTIFNEQYSDIGEAPFTKYKVVPQRDRKGYIMYHANDHLYYSTYEAGMVKTDE